MDLKIVVLILVVTCSQALQKRCMGSLDGKVVIITGGAKGIGFAIAKWYLKCGARLVIIVDINKPRGLEAEKILNKDHGANSTVFWQGDITKDLDRLCDEIICKCGYVDILVNNAGVLNEYAPTHALNVNTIGTMQWCYKFYEKMRKDKGGRGGTIVNIGSLASHLRSPFLLSYQCSKRAVDALTFSMGHEWNYIRSGVRVYGIAPGFTCTDMTKFKMVIEEQWETYDRFRKSSEWQTPEDVGWGAVILHETAESGKIYSIVGGKAPVESPDRADLVVDNTLLVEEPNVSNFPTTPITTKQTIDLCEFDKSSIQKPCICS